MKKKYRIDVEASKSLSHKMIINFMNKVIPDKKKFNKKKSRKNKKIKSWQI